MDPNKIRTTLLQKRLNGAIAVFDSNTPAVFKFIRLKSFNYLLVSERELTIIAHKIYKTELEDLGISANTIITNNPEQELQRILAQYPVFYRASPTIFPCMKNGKSMDNIFKEILKKPLEEDLVIFREFTAKIDAALEHAVQMIKIGMREYEVKAEIDYYLERGGIDGFAYNTIVLFGARSAYPLAVSTNKRLEPGEIILIDTAPVYKGYTGTEGRVIFSEQSAFWSEKLELLNRVLEEVRPMLVPGTRVDRIDQYIRESLKHHGYEYAHYTGHALGGFYMPMIYPGATDVLERNMIFTLEPGIYIPKKGGLRIKHHLLVTENQVEILDRFGIV